MQRMHFKIERFFLNKTRAVAYLAIVFGIGGLFFQPGCGSQKVLPPPQQRQHIQEIFHFYLVHKMRNQSTFPTDAEALKTWAVAQSDTEKEMFVRMGIGGKEESAFISPRDQQPYLVQKFRLVILCLAQLLRSSRKELTASDSWFLIVGEPRKLKNNRSSPG